MGETTTDFPAAPMETVPPVAIITERVLWIASIKGTAAITPSFAFEALMVIGQRNAPWFIAEFTGRYGNGSTKDRDINIENPHH